MGFRGEKSDSSEKHHLGPLILIRPLHKRLLACQLHL